MWQPLPPGLLNKFEQIITKCWVLISLKRWYLLAVSLLNYTLSEKSFRIWPIPFYNFLLLELQSPCPSLCYQNTLFPFLSQIGCCFLDHHLRDKSTKGLLPGCRLQQTKLDACSRSCLGHRRPPFGLGAMLTMEMGTCQEHTTLCTLLGFTSAPNGPTDL